MSPRELLEKIAIKKEIYKLGFEGTPAYFSKIDGSFLGFKPNDVKFLSDRGITEDVQNYRNEPDHTANIGFNPDEQKWYGWSHRAIFGFGIGHTVKMGDAGFSPSNKEEFMDQSLRFWTEGEDYKRNPRVLEFQNENGVKGAYVTWTYSNETPNENLIDKTDGIFSAFPEKWGKGEWTAEKLEDAKQMAIDFARSVS